MTTEILGAVLPWIIAILGSGGIGAVTTALVNSRTTTRTAKADNLAKQTETLVGSYAKDRELALQEREQDRIHRAAMDAKLDTVINRLTAEQLHSADLLAWGLAGAPPPPPQRKTLQGG